MKRPAKLLCGSIALALALAGVVVANEAVTLEGSFVWVRTDSESSGDLTAVLTPNGENEWDVAFHFVWEDEPHTYLGQATGTLDTGAFEGTAENDDPDHPLSFRFSGEFEDGTFSGTHSCVQDDGSLRDGGTLTLSMPDA